MIDQLKQLQERWDEFKKKFKPGFLKDAEHWLNRAPNGFYDLIAGRGAYDAVVAKHGDEDFFGPGWNVAWFRQVFHFLGGSIGAAIGCVAIPEYAIAIPPAIVTAIALYETQKSEGTILKRSIDVAAWAVGAASGFAIFFFFFA